MRPAVTLVAAVARGGTIGDRGAMPWRMRSDLRHFKSITLGKPLVMGRKTFESIGKPLPGRETIVVTRDPGYAAAGAHVARDVTAALALAAERAAAMGADEVIVAGGGEIYRQTIGQADRLVVTELDLERDGDARFPPVDAALWREVGRSLHPAGPGDDAAFAIVEFRRR